MSSGNTETRILQMQLENRDFEEGVRQTIKSLEDLEEKLNLKHAGDGFEKVSAAANSVQMSHLESGLDTITNKFTLMGQIGLQVLERISSKVIDTSEKILRAATIQPVIDGWGEFETKTNSVQTILGGIRSQFSDQPTAIHAITGALDELNEYADKTIYNFAQMTENVGKFTNQGLNLKTSTAAIKGIANWAAAVGANPAQMSRAMYNISQSLGAGHMQRIDWRSIMFANMATPEVKQMFAEVAKAQGQLAADGVVTIGKKAYNVINDFEETLQAGWMTNEVIAEGLGIYAKAFSEAELISRYGEDLGKKFYEMGVYAEEAATKVRTFSQLMGVMAESLGSGWATTFDILFGGFEQQTEFLTLIKDRLEAIVNFQTEDRNTWLQRFSDIGGIVVFQDVILKTIDILSDFYWVFNDVAALIFNPFGDSVFNMSDGIFGPRQEGYTEMKSSWEGIKAVFEDISASMDSFRSWMYTPDEKKGRSPIHNLARALSGVAGAAGIAWQVLSGFGKFVFRIFKRFAPLVSSVLDLLGQIGGAIYNVFFNLTGQQSIEKVFDNIEKAVGPVVDLIVGLASAVVDLIHSFLGIDSAADDWTVLGERMKAFWEIFTYDPDLTFAENLKNSLKKALEGIFGTDVASSLIEGWDNNVAPVLERVSGIFTEAFNTLFEAVFGHEVIGKQGNKWRQGGIFSLPQTLSEFFNGQEWKGVVSSIQTFFDPVEEALTTAWNEFIKFLFGGDEWIYSDSEMGYKVHNTGLIETILDFFDEDNLKEVKAKIETFFAPVGDALSTAWKYVFGSDEWIYSDSEMGYKVRHNGLIDRVREFFSEDNLTEIKTAIQTFFEPIGTAIGDAWNKLNGFLFGHEMSDKYGNRWLEGGIFSDLVNFFSDDNWSENLLTSATQTWDKVYTALVGTEVSDKYGNKWLEGGVFSNLINYFTTGKITQDWESVKSKFEEIGAWVSNPGMTIWNTVMEFLFGPETEDGQGNKTRTGGAYHQALEFLTPVWDWISETGSKLYDYITTHNFQQMWEGLKNLLFGYDEWVYSDTEMGYKKHTDGVLTPVVELLRPIADVFNQIKGWALEKIGGIDWSGIWASVGKFFAGYDEWVYSDSEMGYKVHHEGAFDRIIGFFEQIIEYFQSPEFQEFLGTVKSFYHTYIEPVLNWVSGLGGQLWGAIQGLFSGQGFGAFEGVGNYLSEGFNKLIGNIFPEGFSLSGIFGDGFSLGGILDGLLGGNKNGDAAKEAASAADKQNDGGFDPLGWFLGLISGSADAAEAEGEELVAATDGVVVNLEKTKADVESTTEKGTSTMNSILGAVSKFLPYVGGAAAIGLVGKVSDMIVGITGNRKPTILEQIANLLRSLGEPFKGLGIALAGAGFAEKIAPGTIDNVFGHITTILDKIFGWIKTLGLWEIFGGGGMRTLGNWGFSLLTGASGGFNFGGISSVIGSIGTGIQGLMDSLQTLFWLTLEVSGADWLMGSEKQADGTTLYKFDERMDRVLGFVSKVLSTVTGGSWLSSVFTMANTFISGTASAWSAALGNKNFQAGETIAGTLAGIGTLAASVCDGVAALMSASIVPQIMNVDVSKIESLINAVFTGLNVLAGIAEAGKITSIVAAINKVGFWSQLKTWGAAAGGLGLVLSSIGLVAGKLVDWYADLAKKHMVGMAGGLSVFAASFESSITSLSSVSGDSMSQAISVITNDMPRIFKAVTANDIGYDKAVIEERGKAIRDFGNRVKIGIRSIAAAKDTFDKYNTGDGDDFPLAFFRSMTAALEYLKTGGIKELYEEFFATGFGGGPETSAQDEGVLGIVNFFDSLGHLGYVITKYDNTDFWGHRNSGTKIESTSQYFSDFQDSFAGVQETFSSLVDDMGKEGFSVENINALANFMTKLGEAGSLFAEAYVDEFITLDRKIYKKHGETSVISDFGAWIASVGKGIRDFDSQLRTNGTYDINYSHLTDAIKAIEPLVQIERILNGYAEAFSKEGKLEAALPEIQIGGFIQFLNGKEENKSFREQQEGIRAALEWESNTQHWLDDIMPRMSQIGQGLHQLAVEIKPEDINNLSSATSAINSLASFMAVTLYPDIQIMTVDQIGSYASAFSGLKQSLLMPEGGGNTIASTIQDVMNATGGNALKLQIVPIVDSGDPNKLLPEGMQMENSYSRMITMQMNMNDIQNVRIVDAQIASIVTANNETRAAIDGLARAMSQIRIQVNPSPYGNRGGSSGPRSVQAFPLVAAYQMPYDEP